MNKDTMVIVFSKNRAMQLDLCLRSFFKYCQDDLKSYDMVVLWTADNQEHKSAYYYLDYMNRNKCLFYKERDFKDDLLWFVEDYKFTMFIVDDCVFTNNFSISKAKELLYSYDFSFHLPYTILR